MGKPLKISLIVIGSVVVLAIIGNLISNAILTTKLQNFLKNSLPDTVKVNYDAIDISTINGRVVIINPRITNFGSTNNRLNVKLNMDSLSIKFGYWDYFFKDKINIENVQLKRPLLTYYHTSLIDKKEYKYSKLEQLKQEISIHRINIQQGELSIHDLESDSLLLKIENLAANMENIYLNEKMVKRRIPFLFGDYNVHFDNLKYQLNDYENLLVSTAKITQKEFVFKNLKLYTKYSKPELTKMISFERDHFDISIDSLALKQLKFGYKENSIFYFKIPQVVFYEPKMKIYRNKLVADDVSVKLMYSDMLRNLNFDLTLNEILLKNASIAYSEKVKVENSSGTISFSKLNATIKNVSNTYSFPDKTSLDIDAIFMKSTPIKADWYFDVNNVNDHFVFKADVGRLPAQDLNPFSEPNLKVKFVGELLTTYFTIDGNVSSSSVALRTNYDDFKVIILEKNGKSNKFLSTIVNLFIEKNSDKEFDNFREGEKKVLRNQTKSIFNFLWLNARSGLLSALTGNGKKKE